MLSAVACAAAILIVSTPVREREKNGLPHIRSESALVRFADTKEVLYSKNADVVRPIASVTKLISGLVLARMEEQPAEEYVTICEDDKDRVKWSRSRLRVGLSYRPADLFDAALGASENRAMYAAVRARGLARAAFVEKMNALAKELGMDKSAFRDPAGIDPGNVSTATDLLALIEASAANEAVCSSTNKEVIEMIDKSERTLTLYNPNRLVRSSTWDVVVGKTGYTVEAGRALVLRVRMHGRPIDMVFLGAREMASVFGDAGRVRRWLDEKFQRDPLLAATATSAASIAAP